MAQPCNRQACSDMITELESLFEEFKRNVSYIVAQHCGDHRTNEAGNGKARFCCPSCRRNLGSKWNLDRHRESKHGYKKKQIRKRQIRSAEPPSISITSTTTNGHELNVPERTGRSFHEVSQPERPIIDNIEVVLNYDSDTSATRARGSLLDQQRVDGPDVSKSKEKDSLGSLPIHAQPETNYTDAVTSSQIAIRLEQITIQQIALERPDDILGEIWFGSPQGFAPFVSLRLSRALGDHVRLSGREVPMPEPALDTSRPFTAVYSIDLRAFRQLIQRDGFGAIFWNENGGEAFVAMQVMDKKLIADFIEASQAVIDVLPALDTVGKSV